MLQVPVVAGAQDVTAPALKAAFIYSFIKFTEWPATGPVSTPFLICLIGDAEVGDALEQVVEGREVAGRRIETLAVSRPTSACGVLYLSGMTLRQATQALDGLQDLPVLTISDIAGFAKAGGMAQLFADRGRLRFTITLGAVERSGLKMSSRLLSLGR